MAIMTPAKFHFNWLMFASIFGIWASEPPPPGPGKRLKRPGLIGLNTEMCFNEVLEWSGCLPLKRVRRRTNYFVKTFKLNSLL